MIKGAIFDMDGTLVANSPVHIRAFEIFCDRYGVRGWKEKLGGAFGRGNDDIMRLIMPEEVIREKGTAALGDEKEAIYLSLIHISEPTRLRRISYAVFCLKKKKTCTIY